MRVLAPVLVLGVSAVAEPPTALQSVVGLLLKMKTEAETAQDDALQAYTRTSQELTAAIVAATDEITKQTGISNEEAANGDVALAKAIEETAEIAANEKIIATKKDDIKALRSQREAKKESYDMNLADAQAGLAACRRLVEALEAVPGGDGAVTVSFMQTQLDRIPSSMNGAKALLQAVEKFANDAPQQTAYARDNAFSAIIQLVNSLQTELQDALSQINREEQSEIGSFKTARKSAETAIQNSEDAKTTAEGSLAEAQEAEAQAVEAKALADRITLEQKTLKDETVSLLNTTTTEHDDAHAARTGEIDAIGKAIGILNGDLDRTKTGAIHSVEAATTGSVFLQVNRQAIDEDSVVDKKAQALDFLRQRGATLHSKTITMLTEVASADPFAKITKMIGDLIERLKTERDKAADHHTYCTKAMKDNDTELKARQKDKLKFEVKIEEETANRDAAEANEAEQKAEKEKLTQFKSDELATFNETIKSLDAEIASGEETKTALGAALTVLGKGNASTSDTFSGSKGMASVITFLENIQANHEHSLEAAKTSLKETNDNWDDRRQNLDTAIAAADRAETDFRLKKAGHYQKVADTVESLEANEMLLVSALGIKQGLEEKCMAQGASHEENHAKREEEIKSLEEALEILSAGNDQ